jgi:hypothetical protein
MDRRYSTFVNDSATTRDIRAVGPSERSLAVPKTAYTKSDMKAEYRP